MSPSPTSFSADRPAASARPQPDFPEPLAFWEEPRPINRLHFIASTPLQAAQACAGGVRWVQLRVKNQPYAVWRQLAVDTQAVCRRFGATFIINDNPQLTQEIGADGVHLGRQDMPADEARAILGPAVIIGGTANTLADMEELVAAGVDYIGLGPFRFTTTKTNLSPILGLAGYRELLAQFGAAGHRVPIIGIGGIGRDDVALLRAAGLHGVAVAGAIAGAHEPAVAAAGFLRSLAAVR